MRDYLKDIVQHTHGLGFIEAAKIVNEEGATSLEAMDDDRTVIVQAQFKEQVPGLSGTFGLPNLSKLNILLNIDEYKDNANITVNEQERNGETVPFGLHFENANGGDIYIYPAFLAIVDSNKKFGLVDIRELDFSFHGQRFIESENVPKDAEVVDHTWAKVNKNGTPDKRFKGNYQIPICKYGEIELTSSTGLNEAYSISNYVKSENFANSMLEYQKIIKK